MFLFTIFETSQTFESLVNTRGWSSQRKGFVCVMPGDMQWHLAGLMTAAEKSALKV